MLEGSAELSAAKRVEAEAQPAVVHRQQEAMRAGENHELECRISASGEGMEKESSLQSQREMEGNPKHG